MNLIEENGCENEVVKYLDATPTLKELKETLAMLGFKSAREWMRTKEDIYKELNLALVRDEDALLNAMCEHPKLIERPVLIKNNKAIIGRPTSIIADFLQS
jgi:arsenate reductase